MAHYESYAGNREIIAAPPKENNPFGEQLERSKVMISQEKRAQLAKKIKALLSKTQEAGCTEEEALNAAILAAKLQAEYNITLTETELLAEGFERIDIVWTSERHQFIEDRIATEVARFTSTRCWVNRPSFSHGTKRQPKRLIYKMIFCGLKSDVIFARWLLEALRDYIDRAGTFFVVTNCLIGPERSMAYKSFVLGVCARVVERLRLAKLEDVVQSDTGRALVVVDKQALIAAYLKEQGVTLEKMSGTTDYIRNSQAYQQGKIAGENVGLNRPINQGETTCQIAKK